VKSIRDRRNRREEVSGSTVVTTVAAAERALPPQIQEALGELVGAAREGLLALSVGVGLGVVHELMELEVDEVVGPKGKRGADGEAARPRGRLDDARRTARAGASAKGPLGRRHA
jgi:hypothetical protein